ncbi:MAG: hypothetical protein RR576_08000 [Oscillospiraceae bacterium]
MMIIPLIFDIAFNSKAVRLGEYYEFVKMQSKQKYGAIIAQEDYCKPISYFKENNRSEASSTLIVSDEPISEQELSKVHVFPLPTQITSEIIANCGSNKEASLFLVENRCAVLENWISQTIKTIEYESNEKIEAVILFSQYVSVEKVLNENNIKFFYYEVGAFRANVYSPVVYFDLIGSIHQTQLRSRYFNFLKEQGLEKRYILDGKEILSLMLQPEYMSLLDMYGAKAQYACGVAMQGKIIDSLVPKVKSSNEQNILMAINKYGSNNVLIRSVPKDYDRLEISTDGLIVDKSATATEFMLKCDCVISRLSNMAYEALLWGRKSMSTEEGLYDFAGVNQLDEQDYIGQSSEFLSFVAFGFYMPREFLYNIDYLKWRLSYPSETEIYMCNLEYRLRQCGLLLSDIQPFSENRIYDLLQKRKHEMVGSMMPAHKYVKEINAIIDTIIKSGYSFNKAKSVGFIYDLGQRLLQEKHYMYVISERDKELKHTLNDLNEVKTYCNKLEEERAQYNLVQNDLNPKIEELQADICDCREKMHRIVSKHSRLTDYLKNNRFKAAIKLILGKELYNDN